MNNISGESVIVDTGGFYAAFVETDSHHEEANALFEEIRSDRTFHRVFTSRYILSEFATTMLYSVGHRKAVDALTMVLESETFNLLPVGHTEFMTAWERFQRYDDQDISFVDHSTAVLACKYDVEHVFGFDSDFETLGFTLVPFDRY